MYDETANQSNTLGLDYALARYYSSPIGRFLSIDSAPAALTVVVVLHTGGPWSSDARNDSFLAALPHKRTTDG